MLSRQMHRLQFALALEAASAAQPPPPPQPQSDADDVGEYELNDGPPVTDASSASGGDGLRRAFGALGGAAPAVEDMRHQWVMLAALVQHLNPAGGNSNPDPLVEAVIARSRKLARALADVRDALHKVPYPFEHVERHVSLAGFVVKAVPAPEDVGHVYHAAGSALDAYYPLYLRILSDLCTRAEAVEQSLGLDPLPQPKEQPETAGA